MAMPLTRSTPVTRDEMLRRASELVPVLKERAAQAEQLRRIPAETVAEIVSAGLLRVGNPDRFGGVGLEPDASFEVAAELGRGCGSTAWCYSIWTIHNWAIGHWPEQAQEEYFADSPDTFSSTSFNPARSRVEAVAGGYRLSGRWDFSSGCDEASWAILAGAGPSGVLWLLVPAGAFRIEDTWFVSGLRGTGSKDLVVDDAFVPAHRAAEHRLMLEGRTDGWAIHGRASYRVPLNSLLGFTLSAPVLGMAQGALEAFVEQLSDRTMVTGARMAESVGCQLRLAEASAAVDAARLLMWHDCREMLERAARGEPATLADRARYKRDQAFMTRLCIQAIDQLFEASGGNALFESNPLQRFHRDAHAGSHHFALRWDFLAEQYGRIALGLDPGPNARL
jgi:alkylation response protein AidB-like acyl-CoA dehydrogenase